MWGKKRTEQKRYSRSTTEVKEEAKELYVEEGPDLDVSLHFYQHFICSYLSFPSWHLCC